MGGAAQREEMADESQYLRTGTEGGAASPLKSAVAERLAAHRNRRAAEQASIEAREARAMAQAEQTRKESRRGASKVRDAVAARYQQSQSYREFLAAEAERALQQAQAEAEVAARTMRAVAEAQQKLLDELATYDDRPEPMLVESPRRVMEAAPEPTRAEVRSELAHELADIVLGARELIAEPTGLSIVELAPEPQPHKPVPGVSVKMHEGLAQQKFEGARIQHVVEQDTDELADLEDEIAFRQAPEFAPMTLDATPIPANIIEFPRQLIAPRKARPRLAEGPLVDESPAEPQLRIFEVEAEQVSYEPEPVRDWHGAAEWQSVVLDSAAPMPQHTPEEAQAQLTFQPQPASLERRAMAVAVDALYIATSFVLFAGMVSYFVGPSLTELKPTLLAGFSAVVLAVFYLGYQFLFSTFTDATPGMRYARIALCTFGDDYPSRKAIRRRIGANLLAACPLGLGFAWVLMDGDRLGWHDRISRMYRRAY
ncbi:RDD family protein [Granulicella cerasi]|uniref:RDD family protein n=1 Tax=Granulicella cerasi TaxID=741063 RepID=A0ABW1ZAM1_9BACT|nr:RDD family protein [Granulicella cerasi]